ncbi:hypothetical protein R3P38DRAFT_18380 [Favolaschia claudopus]|uniref:Uncharacterized protein n=1 Tax=Favolaschia claudopus TaxID=2862362 RepID=A0AAW0EGN4_9AGAR
MSERSGLLETAAQSGGLSDDGTSSIATQADADELESGSTEKRSNDAAVSEDASPAKSASPADDKSKSKGDSSAPAPSPSNSATAGESSSKDDSKPSGGEPSKGKPSDDKSPASGSSDSASVPPAAGASPATPASPATSGVSPTVTSNAATSTGKGGNKSGLLGLGDLPGGLGGIFKGGNGNDKGDDQADPTITSSPAPATATAAGNGGGLANLLSDVVGGVTSAVGNVVGGVTSAVGDAVGAVTSVVGDVTSAVGDVTSAVGDVTSAVGDGLGGGKGAEETKTTNSNSPTITDKPTPPGNGNNDGKGSGGDGKGSGGDKGGDDKGNGGKGGGGPLLPIPPIESILPISSILSDTGSVVTGILGGGDKNTPSATQPGNPTETAKGGKGQGNGGAGGKGQGGNTSGGNDNTGNAPPTGQTDQGQGAAGDQGNGTGDAVSTADGSATSAISNQGAGNAQGGAADAPATNPPAVGGQSGLDSAPAQPLADNSPIVNGGGPQQAPKIGPPADSNPSTTAPEELSTVFSSSVATFVTTSLSESIAAGGQPTTVPVTITSTGFSLVPVATNTKASPQSAQSGSSSKTATMAGGIVGGLVLLIGLILLGLFLRKRRRNQALYLSSRPDSPLRDVERNMSSHSRAPVFSMVMPPAAVAPPVIPSIVVAPAEMTEASSHSSKSSISSVRKPVPSINERDLAALEGAPVTANKPMSYVLDVDPPTSSMAFDSASFAQSLGQNPAWAAVLAPTASANPFEDPVNPFMDPKSKTRLSEMPEIPKHLRMSTTSSTLSRNDDAPSSPTSTIYHQGFAM